MTLVEIFINWFPMVIVIGIFVWVSRKVLAIKRSVQPELHLAEMRRQNAALERIASALEASGENAVLVPPNADSKNSDKSYF